VALPKRRHSKTRGRKRRTHYGLTKKGTTVCSHCDTVKEPHVVCPNCGHYAGREALSMEKS
jgi:large subunit ribosomal protein L32